MFNDHVEGAVFGFIPRAGAPALERNPQEAPASSEDPGGGSLQGSVFRGWSLGTRKQARVEIH